MNSTAIVFGNYAQDYDNERRFLIPCYDAFYEAIVREALKNPNATSILDIGAGTGLLSAFLLPYFESASFTLIDYAPEMLSVARKRFAAKLCQFEFIAQDYLLFEYFTTYDLVVSSLSIHHLDNLQKMILFHRVYQMLRPGGLFILGDLALAEDEQTEQETQRLWSEFINKSPLDAVAKCNAHERIALDMPAKISELTAFFQYSGFANVQLSFQYRNFTVFTCLKSNL